MAEIGGLVCKLFPPIVPDGKLGVNPGAAIGFFPFRDQAGWVDIENSPATRVRNARPINRLHIL